MLALHLLVAMPVTSPGISQEQQMQREPPHRNSPG